jgi:hypothetical protein
LEADNLVIAVVAEDPLIDLSIGHSVKFKDILRIHAYNKFVIEELVRVGQLSISIINEAVKGFLRHTLNHGLFPEHKVTIRHACCYNVVEYPEVTHDLLVQSIQDHHVSDNNVVTNCMSRFEELGVFEVSNGSFILGILRKTSAGNVLISISVVVLEVGLLCVASCVVDLERSGTVDQGEVIALDNFTLLSIFFESISTAVLQLLETKNCH